ncbi:sensor histidine kinase [Hymenobacter baengnokdamensis]|uniref:sensor histidine kinase n=1 Tax=Hymenobacter baengnokdamensis TaxID=2615203 RepID=UPI00177DE582|nr:histidine kinase [Hymenobacter baengnokdamensis]
MPGILRPRLYWTLQGIGWALYGLFGGILASIFGRFSPAIIAVEIIVAATLLLFSHLLRRYLKRHGWVRLPLSALLPRLLLAHLLVTVVSITTIGLLTSLFFSLWRPTTSSQGFPWVQYIGYTLNVFFVLWGWSAIYFGLHYFDNYRSAEVDKWKLAATAREAEMRTLQAQLNPHFLFNGLNNIRALVMEDPARARAMMTHLAELLRYSMQRNGAEQVPLATELEIVENYLQLEAMQLEERLHYSLDVMPAALPALLPPMTLQLLVENAIKHGLAPRPAGGQLSVSAQLNEAGTGLLIAVRNTGTYAPQPGHPGLGVRNVQERLGLLFGSTARFAIGPDPLLPDTVLAELQLPVHHPQLLLHERPAH